MKGNFLKFKSKLLAMRIFKSFLAGLSAGLLLGGLCLTLSKLAIIGLEPLYSLPVGAVAFLLIFLMFFFLLKSSDQKLAQTLDQRFSLFEKVQTMVAFREETGEMAELQREDAEQTLGSVRKRRLGAKRLWIYLLVLCLGAAAFTAGVLAENKRDYVPPEQIVPFAISDMQIAGLEELIKYVDSSAMEEPYRKGISQELSWLLAELKKATTEPEMQAALATSITNIAQYTYDSSSMTEILNELWKTEDPHIRNLAKALNTSNWSDPDWGDFAEKYDKLKVELLAIGTEREESDQNASLQSLSEEELKAELIWALENISRKINAALSASGISSEDRLYLAIDRLVNANTGTRQGEHLFGLATLSGMAKDLTYQELLSEVENAFAGMTEELYAVISAQKTNTNVGEYVLKRLELLFAVPIPPFERPDLSQDGGSNDSDQDFNQDDAPGPGGVGEGVVFGSKDLVLDPLTGNYVEYGTLYAKYNRLMIEKLEDEKYGYTEEQKKAIEKYFALLYGGLKEEEGN